MDVDTNMSVRRARSPYIVANKIARKYFLKIQFFFHINVMH